MEWKDEAYLFSKTNYSENSIIIDAFTLNHGKYTGIVYGGSSRKNKKNFQIGNKININWKSKGENNFGYFNVELIKAVAPLYFDNKRKTICILAAISILKVLLPERQINKNIYLSFENLINNFKQDNWIELYILWELSLIKELGYEVNYIELINSKKSSNNTIKLNNISVKVPKILLNYNIKNNSNIDIKEALLFNNNLLMENFITPSRLKMPLSRRILEKYYS